LALKCGAGYYLTRRNKCQLCPVGRWSSAGVTKCTTCPAGTKTSDHLSCKDCVAGKYSGAGSARCKPCGVGQVSQRKASNCTACTSGQYASHSDNICKPCEKGTYSMGSVDSCIAATGEPTSLPTVRNVCVDGSYSDPVDFACAPPCLPGQHYDDLRQLCTVCKPGYKTMYKGGCEACGQYEYAPRYGSKECASCNSNKLVNADKTRCDYCPASFRKESGRYNCEKCPGGQYSTGDIEGCRSCQGMSRANAAQTGCEPYTAAPTHAPTVCLPGQGQSITSSQACVDCGPGYMSRSADQTCVPCGLGTYSNIARPTSCITCDSLKVVSADRTKCEWCEASFYKEEFSQDYPLSSPGREAECPAGTYSTPQGAGCLECPNYGPVNAAQTGCAPVPDGPPVPPNPPRAGPGKVYDTESKSIVDCLAGQEKQFSFQSCTYCAHGYYAKLPGTAKCSICDGLNVGEIDHCGPCKPGYTKTAQEWGPPICQRCPQFMISDGGSCKKCPTWEKPSADMLSCVRSDPYYCSSWGEVYDSNLNECVPCKPGTSTEDSLRKCGLCTVNYFAPKYGETACYICPEGMATGVARDDCFFCEASYYQQSYAPRLPKGLVDPTIEQKAPDCVKCAPGTYSVYADTGCHTCPAGKTINAGQTGCE
jgi:hypothetical protein